MPERPSWLKIVGGKEHKSSVSEQPKEADKGKVPEIEQSQIVNPEELVGLFRKVTGEIPVDWNLRINPHIVNERAGIVMSWTMAELHAYLCRNDIWEKPSQTRAVMDEVAERISAWNFSPRK